MKTKHIQFFILALVLMVNIAAATDSGIQLTKEQVAMFTLACGALMTFVQGLKNYAEKLELWTSPCSWLDWVPKVAKYVAHSWGPFIMTFIIPSLVLILEHIKDGIYTMPELSALLKVWGISVGATLLHWFIRKSPVGRLWGKKK